MKSKLLSILLILLINQKSQVSHGQELKKCKLSQVHGLKAIDCHDLGLEELPKGLTSDVQILDVSTNRIRKITRSQLEKYPYIMHLYLQNNFIQKLESDTLDPLSNLQTLDLSLNGLLKVPSGIFQLPGLKTLYLSQNMNLDIAESAEFFSDSSLSKLDISYISEKEAPIEFPNFGENSLMLFLNISGNYFTDISTTHFAGLCNLQTLSNSDVNTNFLNACDCWNINNWLDDRRVNFTAFRCPIKETECNSQFISNEDTNIYKRCQQKTQQLKRSTLLRKIGLWTGVAFLVILILGLILVYRYWVKRRRQKTEQEMNLMRTVR